MQEKTTILVTGEPLASASGERRAGSVSSRRKAWQNHADVRNLLRELTLVALQEKAPIGATGKARSRPSRS